MASSAVRAHGGQRKKKKKEKKKKKFELYIKPLKRQSKSIIRP